MRRRLSANLGFLWKELPVQERIGSAAAAGFAAIEFHDQPLHEDVEPLATICRNCRVDAVSLNTQHGETNGRAAIADQASEARADIVAALEVARKLRAGKVHVVAGNTPDTAEARRSYVDNLRFACDQGARSGIDILIEPISPVAMPGYFLSSLELADEMFQRIDRPNLKLLFDCFHIHAMGHDLAGAFERRVSRIGHVQIAGIPGRNEPDRGVVDYHLLLARFVAAGYAGKFGCEYRPSGATVEAGLEWMRELQ